MKVRSLLAATGAAAALVAAVPSAASARPAVDCQRAGLAVLRDAGLLPAVAKSGLPISTALAVGVTLRDPATDVSALPDPLPLSLVLADHRAGDASIFVYPWCG